MSYRTIGSSSPTLELREVLRMILRPLPLIRVQLPLVKVTAFRQTIETACQGNPAVAAPTLAQGSRERYRSASADG